MKGRHIVYSAAELGWIIDNSTRPRAEAHADFLRVWNRTDVSLVNFAALCKRKGWTTGRSGRFQAGQAAHNKGRKMPYNANSAATRFKPGKRTGRAKQNYKPIGAERITPSGYVERKINDDLPFQARWRAVHLIRWEAAHGPVPDDHCLKCLDADKANTDPANWRLIPRALLPRLNGRWTLGYDEAEPELKATLLALAEVEHAARRRRKA